MQKPRGLQLYHNRQRALIQLNLQAGRSETGGLSLRDNPKKKFGGVRRALGITDPLVPPAQSSSPSAAEIGAQG